jgi:hypothetical protein
LLTGKRGSGKIAKGMDAVEAWGEKWGMVFNVGRCKVMHIGLLNNLHQYTMRGKILQTTDVKTDIGVEVTDNLPTSSTLQ